MLGVRVQMNPTLLASTQALIKIQRLHSEGRHPSGRPRGLRSHLSAPPGTEMLVAGPQKLVAHQGPESWGGFWSVLSSEAWLWQSSSALGSELSRKALSSMRSGLCIDVGGVHPVSMLSSTSSSTTMSESPC